MCGRFSLAPGEFEIWDLPHDTERELRRLINESDGAKYNVPPGTTVPTLRLNHEGGMEAAALRWGLVPGWADDPKIGYKMINARAETVATKPAFRSAFKNRRCLIVACGFYEWKREGKRRQPYFVTRADGKHMALAGVWEHWRREEVVLDSCAIITTEANSLMATIHDRMPVIVDETNFEIWLDPNAKEAANMLAPWDAAKMRMHPVTPNMNKVGYDESDCISAISA